MTPNKVIISALLILGLIVLVRALPFKRKTTIRKPYIVVEGDTIYKPIIVR